MLNPPLLNDTVIGLKDYVLHPAGKCPGPGTDGRLRFSTFHPVSFLVEILSGLGLYMNPLE